MGILYEKRVTIIGTQLWGTSVTILKIVGLHFYLFIVHSFKNYIMAINLSKKFTFSKKYNFSNKYFSEVCIRSPFLNGPRPRPPCQKNKLHYVHCHQTIIRFQKPSNKGYCYKLYIFLWKHVSVFYLFRRY